MKTLIKYLAMRMDNDRPVSREELATYLSVLDMTNETHMEEEFKNFLKHERNKRCHKKDIIDNEINKSNIGKKFMEDAINEMYDEQDDYHTGF